MIVVGTINESDVHNFYVIDDPADIDKYPELKEAGPDNLIYFPNKFLARAVGYVPSNLCSCMLNIWNDNRNEIESFTKANGFKISFYDDSLFLESLTTAWRIYPEYDGRLIVLHGNTENYRNLKKLPSDETMLIHHYHNQHYRGENNIMSILKYIVEHDNWKEEHEDDYKKLPSDTNSQKQKKREEAKKQKRRQKTKVINLLERLENG